MLLVALIVSLCMPVMAQNANTALDLDDVTGVSLNEAVGKVVYIQNVATGLYLKAGGEWGTNAVEGRAAQPFYLEKRTDGSYVISSIAGFFHSSEMWVDWKLRTDSRWTLTQVSGNSSNQYYLLNANGRALASQGHTSGQLAMSKHNANSYSQKWVFVTEAKLKEQMGHSTVTASSPIDVTALIKASSFDLTDGVEMNKPDESNPWKDDAGNNISVLPIYSQLGNKATYSSNWSNFSTYGRYNWHSMIRGGWGETSVYNGAGIISGDDMSNAVTVSQSIASLPKGKYYFSFEGFYRYQTSSGLGGFFDAIGDAFRDIKFQVVISAGNNTIKTFDLKSNTSIAINSDPVEKSGQEVAKVFRDNDTYKQYYEFDLSSQSNVTITIRKTSTSSDEAWICVDNFTLVYYGSNTSAPDVEDLSDLYNSRLQAYIDKIREELNNYPGASTELKNQALGVFNDGISGVEEDMAAKVITTEELYREALSVIDQAYRDALALLDKPQDGGDYTYKILNPSFEFAADGHTDMAAYWVRHGNSSRAENNIATDGSYVGTSAGLPLVQEIDELQYGLYHLTADVTSDAGNTVYLMGEYYHKGVTIKESNKMQSVELYFLLDNGYAPGSNTTSDEKATAKTVIGVVGGSGENNKYYNFHGGIESASEEVTKQVTEEVTKQVEKTREVENTESNLSQDLTIGSSNYKNGTLTLSNNKGSLTYSSNGSWSNRSSYCYLDNGKNMTIAAKANSGETLLITKVTITCTSSSYKGGSYTLTSDVTSFTSGSDIVLSSSAGVQSITLTNGSSTQLRPKRITVVCKRIYKDTETYYETVTETVTKTVTETVAYDKLTADQTIQGCAFKVDNFKLVRVCNVPNGRLFMELEKARNAQFADGITPDIASYETMFQNRAVSNDASSDYGYNPAQRVMEILRNTAKQQRSAGADMTYAIFNQNFDYHWLNGSNLGYNPGWTGIGSGDTGERNNHFQYTTSVTDAEGKVLFNTWSQGIHLTQTITGIPNGRYRLEAMVASGNPGYPGTVYLTAKTAAQTELYKVGVLDLSCGKVFNKVSLEFDVTDGTATIGTIGGNNDDDGVNPGSFNEAGHWWYKADNFRLTYLGKSISFEETAKTIEQVQDYYTSATVNRTLKANGKWSSFVVPFDISADLLTGWEVKELVNAELKNNGEHITLVFDDAADGIKAGVPYMVRNTSLTEAVKTITVNNVNVDTKMFNHRVAGCIAFVGVYTRQYVPLGAYFISDNKFYKSVNENNRDNISGFRAYFELTDAAVSANVRSLSFRIGGEDETEIDDVIMEDEEVEVVGIYDVNGARLSEMKSGINILRMNNGTTKKVMVK